MKRLITLFLIALALPAWAGPSGETPGDAPVPREDVRAIRDIQSRVYGSPLLASDAPRGEAILALAELSTASSSGSLQNPDYDALFALLQRYRDELLKMGLDATELDTQLKNLRVRADELQDRLDKLKPKDGMKIDGRVYSAFDDLHVLGAAALNAPGVAPKPAGVGQRYQIGVVHSELQMTVTRGPFSGDVQFDVVSPWGLAYGSMAPRRVYLELRLPVTLQVGDIDASLTPLTLWRNEESEPFEPQPFADRRQRLLDDLLLVPHKWRVEGARATTDMLLFGRQHLDLESVSAIVGNPTGEFSLSNSGNETGPIYYEANGTTLTTRYSTYMEGWRAALPFGGDLLSIADNGLLFWDNTSTSPAQPAFRSMNEMVQSGSLDFKEGIFRANFEYALSSYTAPALTTTAVQDPLTGTAMTYSAGIETASGHLKVFGRTVSSGFHAAGAQGRTQDAAYAFLGPFPTENDQLGANGTVGLDPQNNIPVSFATRFNDVLIPPGTYPAGLTYTVQPQTWQHLLAYNFDESIDPYGAATPNRTGFGAEGDWKFFGGGIRPQASYELFNEIDQVTDLSGQATSPFTMSRMRAGLDFDLKALFKWPFRIGVGYTATTSSNGKQNALGYSYGLNSVLLDGGIEYDISDSMGLNAGYRHMDANGFDDTHWITYTGGDTWDLLGYGLWWKPMENLRFDAVYSQMFQSAPLVTGTALEVDEGMLRLTLEF
jgi:hypothetical protein